MFGFRGYIINKKKLIGASPSDCLMSYPEHMFVGSYSPAEMLSVYFTASANCAH